MAVGIRKRAPHKDALDSRYCVVLKRYTQSKSDVVVAIDIVCEHVALVGRVAVVEGEVYTGAIEWHGIEAHAYLGLYIKSPSVVVVGVYLSVRLHTSIHGTKFHTDVWLKHFIFYKSPPRSYTEGYLIDGVLLVGIEAFGTAQV